jgi:MerR family transcriptional regulator, thiopeptide resistance regulator
MKKVKERWYKASEFARLTGVTVRTLHHYDQLELLRPSGHTVSGYRLYGERDFARLQQIVTLKFIGFSLKQIKSILDRDSFDLKTELRLQREIIAERRRRMDLAVKAIEEAERVMASNGEPDWEVFTKIIEVINMQKDWEWVKNYYSEEQLEKLSKGWSPQLQEKAERDWATLIKDVEAAVDEDPASDRAQSLAQRWSELIEAFTGGDPGIEQNLKKLYADQADWPSTFQNPCSNEVGAFIAKAIAIRKQRMNS